MPVVLVSLCHCLGHDEEEVAVVSSSYWDTSSCRPYPGLKEEEEGLPPLDWLAHDDGTSKDDKEAHPSAVDEAASTEHRPGRSDIRRHVKTRRVQSD